MKLSEQSTQNILEALTANSLLEESVGEEVIKAIEQEKPMNWNLILTKQFRLEQGDANETAS